LYINCSPLLKTQKWRWLVDNCQNENKEWERKQRVMGY